MHVYFDLKNKSNTKINLQACFKVAIHILNYLIHGVPTSIHFISHLLTKYKS